MSWQEYGNIITKGDKFIQSFEVKSAGRVTGLPEDVVEKFEYVSASQRHIKNAPEHAMNEYQSYTSGILGHLLEHIGDLTHRLTNNIKFGSINIDSVMEKVAIAMPRLERGQALLREDKENLEASARFHDRSFALHKISADLILKNYIYGHEQVPVYNKIQKHARDAAIFIGQKDIDSCLREVSALDKALQSPSLFTEQATMVVRDKGGNILTYENSGLGLSNNIKHENSMGL